MAVRAYPIGVALKVVLGVFAVVVAVTVLAGAATARRPLPAAKVVLAAIDRQAAKGHLTPAEAARYRATVNRTALLARRLPPSRAALLQSQLEQAAGIASILTAPRALAIFTPTRRERRLVRPPRLAGAAVRHHRRRRRRLPLLPGKGVRVPPARELRSAERRGREQERLRDREARERARRTAAFPMRAAASSWEYYFDYSGGTRALALRFRAGGRRSVVRPRGRARHSPTRRRSSPPPAPPTARFRAASSSRRAFGPWIRLYSFNHVVVLNAQLQTAISLADYAKSTSDAAAAALAASMQTAAARALPSFNTGYWSYYALPDDLSPLSYQAYVVQLLQTLARKDDRFAAAATDVRRLRLERPLVQARRCRASAPSPSGSRSPPRSASRRSAASEASRSAAAGTPSRSPFPRAPASSRSRSTPPTGPETARGRRAADRARREPAEAEAQEEDRSQADRRRGRLCRRSSSAPGSTSLRRRPLALAAGLRRRSDDARLAGRRCRLPTPARSRRSRSCRPPRT